MKKTTKKVVAKKAPAKKRVAKKVAPKKTVSKNVPTAHIEASKRDIADVVFMPGDPKRAKLFARRFLRPGYKQVNNVRGILAFTGRTKSSNTRVTFMAHGMGMSSMGIYAYELYKFYDVKRIVRLGTAASHKKTIKNFDIVVSKKLKTTSNIADTAFGMKKKELIVKPALVNKFMKVVKSTSLKVNVHEGIILSSDLFYVTGGDKGWQKIATKLKTSAKEMEGFMIQAIADHLKKEAITIVTIAHEIWTSKTTTSVQRETNVNNMAELAIEAFAKV